MSHDDLPPFPEGLDRALELERRVPEVSEPQRIRMRGRLQAAVVAAGALPAASAAHDGLALAAPPAPGVGSTFGSWLPLWTFLAGAVGGGVLVALVRPPQVVQLPPPPVVTAPAPVVSPPAPSLIPPQPAKVSPRPAPAVPAASSQVPPVAPVVDDQKLERERGLIERARVALERNLYRQAEEALSAHQAEFPDGRLQEEREFLWAQAEAGEGRWAQLAQRVDAFRQRFPHSLLLSAMEDLQAQEPAPRQEP